MPAKRLALLAVSTLILVSCAWAQVNELSVTGGRTFVSTQTVPSTELPLHFGNAGSIAFNYGRPPQALQDIWALCRVAHRNLSRMDVNYPLGTNAKDFGGLLHNAIGASEHFFRRRSHSVGERGRRLRSLSASPGYAL